MTTGQQATGKARISFSQAAALLVPYARNKIVEQVKSVAVIVVYLLLFQLFVLGIPVADALVIAVGLALVVAGLAFFMEGLLLGLMPLGESCGIRLPQKAKVPVILAFSFILGVGATFAEPAIGVLKAAGASVKAWEAPLLFVLLNKHSSYLVYAVGGGVGIAVAFGMLRFLYNWSLKPFIYVLYAGLLGMSVWACFDPNIVHLTGLAWDCGGVTTGPVTVPLVLALGIGISRVVGQGGGGASGFGVVTLASAFPIVTVLALGAAMVGGVPQPAAPEVFFGGTDRARVEKMFESREQLRGYVLANAPPEAQLALFEGDRGRLNAFLGTLGSDAAVRTAVFGGPAAYGQWLVARAEPAVRTAVFGSPERAREEVARLEATAGGAGNPTEVVVRNSLAAVQAILPLSLFLILVLAAVLREKISRRDELALGLTFAVAGMSLFNLGIELGLSRLGAQIGENLPASFTSIEMAREKTVIRNFDPALVQTAITADGDTERFFALKSGSSYLSLPFRTASFDAAMRQYVHTPLRGPLFGGHERSVLGIAVVLFFAFVMGYGATLAEPALNALGITVEELTVGTFRKSLLMQAVALGVGVGIAVGVAKIVWNLPLIWLLVPPYLVLLVLTWLSTEEYVNIGWDSAGVTTGPITVPLVLAMGLGISSQVGVVEGFGILAMASAYPILAVLIVGLYVAAKRRRALREPASTGL